MPVTVVCPRLRCRELLRVPDDVRGKRVRCGSCGMTFIVPQANQKPDQPKAGSQASGGDKAES